MRPRYVELLGDALKIEPSPTDYLGRIDANFCVSSYIRSWAFEAQLQSAPPRESSAIRGSPGAKAGSLLRELWGEGQRWPAEDFLRDITGSTLELASVADRVREHLALGLSAPVPGTVPRTCLVQNSTVSRRPLSLERTIASAISDAR